jgi:hypothetical protein
MIDFPQQNIKNGNMEQFILLWVDVIPGVFVYHETERRGANGIADA